MSASLFPEYTGAFIFSFFYFFYFYFFVISFFFPRGTIDIEENVELSPVILGRKQGKSKGREVDLLKYQFKNVL